MTENGEWSHNQPIGPVPDKMLLFEAPEFPVAPCQVTCKKGQIFHGKAQYFMANRQESEAERSPGQFLSREGSHDYKVCNLQEIKVEYTYLLLGGGTDTVIVHALGTCQDGKIDNCAHGTYCTRK